MILFLGDFFFDYDYIPDDIEYLSNWIEKNNYVTILNLESPIGKGNGIAIRKRGPNLASDIKVMDVLKKLRVVGVCLANNHMMDWGESALKDTIDILDSNGIVHVGAGENLDEAVKPMIISCNDNKIAILNFGWDVEETVYADDTAGCAPRDSKIVLSAIQKAKETSNIVIVCMHWGFEYNRLPMPYDIELAHHIIEIGADLIIGHHPHCVQPKEIYKEKFIYYSLGNFYFSGRRSKYTKKFDEIIENQSDYGCMVVYDILTKCCREHLICYNHANNRSDMIENSNLILEDISGINWNTEEYIKLANKRKVNINPVLTCEQQKNNKLLTQLYRTYKIKAMIKAIWGK